MQVLVCRCYFGLRLWGDSIEKKSRPRRISANL